MNEPEVTPYNGSPKTPNQWAPFFEGLVAVSLLVGQAMLELRRVIVEAGRDAERKHHRAELLLAYRQRQAWKTGDIPHLKSLGVNDTALRRIATIEGKMGRPVVRPHQPAVEALMSKFLPFWTLVNPKSTPEARRRAFKDTPWFEHHVEALYRGEHDLARTDGTPGPADHAERIVGRALGMSASTVRQVCSRIRRKRKEWDGAANFPSMTLAQFETWMETGNGPEDREALTSDKPYSR